MEGSRQHSKRAKDDELEIRAENGERRKKFKGLIKNMEVKAFDNSDVGLSI